MNAKEQPSGERRMTKIAEQEYLAMGLHIKLLKDQVARLERLMEKIRITKELPPEGEE